MSEKKSSSTGRTRNYACVVYSESAPSDWTSILGDFCIPAFVSPLHDCDVKSTGEVKKEHYHVMVMFDSVKTFEQAKEIFEAFGGVGCERVQSLRGYARYLCHLDNPEKHLYSESDVRCFGGADYYSVIGSSLDKYKSISEMIDYCKDNNIFCYADLLEYCAVHRFDWFRVLCDNGTVVIKEYLKSRMWGLKSKN